MFRTSAFRSTLHSYAALVSTRPFQQPRFFDASFFSSAHYAPAFIMAAALTTQPEKLLREVGLEPANSTSHNPLEQPYKPAPGEFTRRASRQDLKKFTPVRGETAALTARIDKPEREVDARVAALCGLSRQKTSL